MKKLDKLIKQAKTKAKENEIGVHIIEYGYCYSCKGECKYRDKDSFDYGQGITVINIDIPYNGFADAPQDTLIKIANYEE